MTVGQFFAALCVLLGFLVGAGVATLWFNPLDWFIAGIAVMVVIGGVGRTFGPGRPAQQ